MFIDGCARADHFIIVPLVECLQECLGEGVAFDVCRDALCRPSTVVARIEWLRTGRHVHELEACKDAKEFVARSVMIGSEARDGAKGESRREIFVKEDRCPLSFVRKVKSFYYSESELTWDYEPSHVLHEVTCACLNINNKRH